MTEGETGNEMEGGREREKNCFRSNFTVVSSKNINEGKIIINKIEAFFGQARHPLGKQKHTQNIYCFHLFFSFFRKKTKKKVDNEEIKFIALFTTLFIL